MVDGAMYKHTGSREKVQDHPCCSAGLSWQNNVIFPKPAGCWSSTGIIQSPAKIFSQVFKLSLSLLKTLSLWPSAPLFLFAIHLFPH